jgi:hypothetical protein
LFVLGSPAAGAVNLKCARRENANSDGNTEATLTRHHHGTNQKSRRE